MLTPHPHVAESGSAEEGEIARTDRQAIPEGPALRREIERWFIRRGVPQFIEGYGTEQSMDRRHAAAHRLARRLVLALLVQPADGAVPLEPPGRARDDGLLRLRRCADRHASRPIAAPRPGEVRPGRHRPVRRAAGRSHDLVQQDLFALLFSALNILLGIGVIYIVIGFGLLDIAVWALDRLRDQLVHIATLLSRTLPLLLILVVFLMFAAEIWEAAHALHAAELAAVIGLLIAVGSVLIISTFRPEIQRLEAAHEWSEIRLDAAETPAAPVAGRPVPEGFRVPSLAWLERRNVEFVVLVNQLLQSTFVSLLVFAFLVAFGLIVVPSAVQATWIGGPVTVLAELDVLGEVRALSAELVTVSALLSGIVGLYFTGLALTDPTYRAEHLTAVVGELRMLLAARALYRAQLARTPRASRPAPPATAASAGSPQGR